MAYSFCPTNHGTSVLVIEDGQTVIKPNVRDLINAVALTSEPLRVGESFEVLLEVVVPIDHGGLEVGVTSNHPFSFVIPRTMTDCELGTSIMISGRNIVRNHKRIHHVERSTKTYEVGDVIGVRLNALNCVQFLYNSKCVCTIPLEEDCAMYGVVDLYGKAHQVSIYTGQPVKPQVTPQFGELMVQGSTAGGAGLSVVEDVRESMAIMLQMMDIKAPEDIDVIHSIMKGIALSAKVSMEKRQEVDTELIRQDAPRIFTEYVEFLKLVEKMDFHRELYTFIISICKRSMEFSIAIGNAGLLKLCVDDVRRVCDIPQEYQGIIVRGVMIIREASKAVENITILRQLGYLEAARPCANNSMYQKHFVISAILSMSLIMEANEADLIKLEHHTCQKMLHMFQDAIKDDDHMQDGISATEFCRCFTTLAGSFQNLKLVVSLKGHVLFARLLKYGNSEEQEKAVRALKAHACPPSYHLLSRVPGMLELLRDVQPSWTEATKMMAAATLKQLQDYVDAEGLAASHGIRSTTAAEAERDILDTSRPGKVMMSVIENPKFPVAIGIRRGEVEEELAAMSLSPGATGGHERPQCHNMAQCRQFVESLTLQDAYFTHNHDRCFCIECHRSRAVDDYSKRGSPPQKYTLPVGWCRFGLSVPPKTKALKVHEKWHKAFHGTKKRYLAKILEVGELAVPGHVVLGGEHIFERSVHLDGKLRRDGFNSKKIFVSPSIRYAGTDAYAPQELYISQYGEKFYVRVAFEVFIAPRSYQVGKQTIGLREQLDPGFSNDVIEWTTTQQGSNVLYGLLVNMEKADNMEAAADGATADGAAAEAF